jgi:hypothetical protein
MSSIISHLLSFVLFLDFFYRTARPKEATTTTNTALAGPFNNPIIGFDDKPAVAIDWGSFDFSEFSMLKLDEKIWQAQH